MSLYVCGYVHGGKPKTKVGIARNLRQRFEGLCAASPVHLEAYRAFDVPDFAARWMEREAHRMLSPWRSHGEWFDCDRRLAIDACEIAVSFEEAAEAFWRKRLD
ncbi:MAG: GIY-YIG nuclease family protein [Hyphomicrobiaceae bacterium]|nr:GIY-YIG nuclease family protein [Hyphomicrobiaceae bacterium]